MPISSRLATDSAKLSDMDNLMTPAEAAKVLGVSTNTLVRWYQAGLIDGVRHPSGHHRYVRSSVERIRPVRISSTVTVIHPEGAA